MHVISRGISANGNPVRYVKHLGFKFEVEAVNGRIVLRALDCEGKDFERAAKSLKGELHIN